MSHPLRYILSLVALLAIVSCTHSTGMHGTLSDAILAPGAERPIVEGDEIEILVYAPIDRSATDNHAIVNGQQRLRVSKTEAIEVLGAQSSNEKVLQIVAIAEKGIRVRGLRAGMSNLIVSTSRGSDTIQIHVAKLDHVELDHWVWRSDARVGPSQSVLLRGGVAQLLVTRVSTTGAILTGYKLLEFVEVSPAEGRLETNSDRDTERLVLHIGTKTDQVTLTPKAGTALRLDVVGVDAIASLEIHTSNKKISIAHRDSASMQLIAKTTDGRRILGLDEQVTLHTTTPKTCRVQSLSRLTGDGHLLVSGTELGLCKLVAYVQGTALTALHITIE